MSVMVYDEVFAGAQKRRTAKVRRAMVGVQYAARPAKKVVPVAPVATVAAGAKDLDWAVVSGPAGWQIIDLGDPDWKTVAMFGEGISMRACEMIMEEMKKVHAQAYNAGANDGYDEGFEQGWNEGEAFMAQPFGRNDLK